MKRKVVKQGSATLMVSIPSEWAQKFGIKKGDELEMEEKDRALTITTHKEYKDRGTELNIDNLYPMTLRTVAAIYKAGYDQLKVTFSDPNMIMDVQNVARNEISGFEIVEHGKNYCMVKKIEEGLSEGFEPILRRTFMLLLNMAEESYDAVKAGEHDNLRRLRGLEGINNRLTTYCRRTLSRSGYKEHNKIQFIYHILEQLEQIADQYKYLFDYLLDERNAKTRLTGETLQYYADVNKMLRLYYELFYKFDKEKMVQIGLIRKRLSENVNDLLESKTKKEAVVMHYLITIMDFTFEMVEPYLSMVL